MTRWGMAIDLRRCVGCQTCTIACKQAHNLPPGVFWRRVLDCETGSYPTVQRTFLPLACMHCTDAPCLEVCPTTATRQRADGIVTIDADICVGCAYCVVACPYEARTIMADEVPYFAAGPTPPEVALADPGRVGTCTKCDLCVDRLEAGLDPVCVTSCIGGAMTFGDLDDPKSPVARLLREQESARPLADLGLGPAVAYVGAPAGETLVPPRRQRVWGWQAVANFSLGGIGAGVYLVGPASVRWVGPLLVGLGLLALTTEAGRPLRGLNLFRHLGRSWMSREALAAAIFLPLAMVGLHLAASLAAAAFMISQGFIVRRARGVTAWDSPLVPLVFVASGLAGGTGLALVITGGGFPLLAAVVSLAAWLAYLRPRGGEFDAATQELRSPRWLGLVVGLGHLAPLLLMPVVPRLAGMLLVAGSVAVKAGIVARAGFLRGIRFRKGTVCVVQPGLVGEARLVVDASHLAGQGGAGAVGVAVLGTPQLIALLETAAWNAVQPHLPEGSVTVGTAVSVRHLAATPPGMTVTAHAELLAVDGRRLTFRLWAEDEVEPVAEGQHERMIVPLARLLERAQAKGRGAWPSTSP